MEIKIEGGSSTATKWMTLGRRQNELAYVMPDRRTVFLTDDGANKVPNPTPLGSPLGRLTTLCAHNAPAHPLSLCPPSLSYPLP